MFDILGFKFEYPLLSDDDKKLYFDYNKAKKEKDFATSDLLRAKLIEKKIL